MGAGAPKVMPPIYFHGNYNRFREHDRAGFQQQNTIFPHCVFCQQWRRALFIKKICTRGGDPLFHSSEDGAVRKVFKASTTDVLIFIPWVDSWIKCSLSLASLTHQLTGNTPTVCCFINIHTVSVDEWVQVYLHQRIQWYTSAFMWGVIFQDCWLSSCSK